MSARVVRACAVLVRFTAALEKHQQGQTEQRKADRGDSGTNANANASASEKNKNKNDHDEGDGTQSILEDARVTITCISEVRVAVQTQTQIRTRTRAARVRMDRKLRRAVERCRKACISLLGGGGGGGEASAVANSSKTTGRMRVAVREVCEALVGLLDVFSTAALGGDFDVEDDNGVEEGEAKYDDDNHDDDDDDGCTIALLDTLFQLATVGLGDPTHAGACDRAYAYLVDAERKVEEVARSASISISVSSTVSSEASMTKGHLKKIETPKLEKMMKKRKRLSQACANYTRCLAGAFANGAGVLYRAGRWAFAIRFLRKACPLSVSASALYIKVEKNRGEAGDVEDMDDKGKEKDALAWKTHRIQTFRRWELLGVCHSKVGDRNVRYLIRH